MSEVSGKVDKMLRGVGGGGLFWSIIASRGVVRVI